MDLPLHVDRALLKQFLDQNFGRECIAHTFKPTEGGQGGGVAFLGFATHSTAQRAVQGLDGMAWDGATLRAAFARREMSELDGALLGPAPMMITSSPHGGGHMGGASWPPATPQYAPAQHTAPPAYSGGGGGGGGGSPAVFTLRVMGLPAGCSDAELMDFIGQTAPGCHVQGVQVQSSNGAAYVRFSHPDHATAALGSLTAGATMGGNTLKAAFARRELELR